VKKACKLSNLTIVYQKTQVLQDCSIVKIMLELVQSELELLKSPFYETFTILLLHLHIFNKNYTTTNRSNMNAPILMPTLAKIRFIYSIFIANIKVL